jgi:hypothetical protein
LKYCALTLSSVTSELPPATLALDWLLRVQILQDMIIATEALEGTNKCMTLKDFRERHGMKNISVIYQTGFFTQDVSDLPSAGIEI